MSRIRKTSSIVSLGRGRTKSVAGPRPSSTTTSPFSIKPPDPLKSITQRQSQLSELQRLAILQNALEPFAGEARKHLPKNIQSIEKKVRKRMIQKGFSKEVVSEAGDETVSVLLNKRRSSKSI